MARSDVQRALLGLLPAVIWFAAFTPHAWAWGAVGHRAVADTAERLLCPSAKDEVRRLLALEGYKRLAQVASWADHMKAVLDKGGPRHTIRLPLDREPFNAKRDCSKANCIVTVIAAHSKLLGDRTQGDLGRLAALKFLTHLVGDLHQPFHGTTAGERQIVLNGERQKLHDYWDKGILAAKNETTATLVRSIIDDARVLVRRGDTSDAVQWAQESRDVARDEILPSMVFDGNEIAQVDRPRVERDYVIAKRRLVEGSARLAIRLNDVLGCAPTNRPR